ncbi:MAG TPA: peptide chain release factor N(5)-glutamine methyltransferase [Candidatus Marinimicrobia bacterium]|nr:peptide chain release factor N(5)-glutamine methyltransferase [Candidatus Neomarinimicrobiota bacterium]
MNLTAEKQKKIWRIIDIINWGKEYFRSKGFENPKQEIEWLLCDLLNYKRIDLYLEFENTISDSKLDQLKGWVKRRRTREPLQYITGQTQFYGYPFKVSPDVLIPRPETERVVDVVLHTIGNITKPRILEVGSGSGCMAVSIGAEKQNAYILSIDISKPAIDQARKNADLNATTNVDFMVLDFLKELPEGQFDLLVSNPPYIPLNEFGTTMPEIHNHEPQIALTDNRDGLTFYQRFAEVAKELVKPGGWVIMEVGLGDHPAKAMEIFQSGGYKNLGLITDFNGDERVLKIQI